jgi:hypothetical protein
VTDNDAVSYALNGHFTTIGIQPAADNASDCTTILNQVRNNIILSGIDALEIEEVMFDLKNSEFTGVDGIRLSLLTYCMTDVVPSIVRILNRSFQTAVVPANMKNLELYRFSNLTIVRTRTTIDLSLLYYWFRKLWRRLFLKGSLVSFLRITVFFLSNMDLFQVRVRSVLCLI